MGDLTRDQMQNLSFWERRIAAGDAVMSDGHLHMIDSPPADFDLHTPERYPVEEGSVALALAICTLPAFLMGVGIGWWLL